jgi:diketogulonate reductase-like aldo/keto reductase
MRSRPAPPTIVPIIGARTAQQMSENLGALEVELAPEELARLDEVSAIPLGFPRSFLESENVRNLIYGETWSRLRVPA